MLNYSHHSHYIINTNGMGSGNKRGWVNKSGLKSSMRNKPGSNKHHMDYRIYVFENLSKKKEHHKKRYMIKKSEENTFSYLGSQRGPYFLVLYN